MSKLAVFGGNPVISAPMRRYNPIGSEEIDAVNRVMRSGNLSGFVGTWSDEFFGGPMVQMFEQAWARRFGSKHAVSVNSNTSGLMAAMGAIGVGPGDEVILPPMTMSATAVAPLVYGAVPVFVDMEPDTFCLDPALVREHFTPRTKAILVVNLFGHPGPLAELRKFADERGIKLIEDNAQAPLGKEGDRYAGTIGHIGVFSLNYHKHIHTGEGGVCVTDDDELALRMQLIRNHAESCVERAKVADLRNMIGFNFRMTELCAAVGLEQLKKADYHVGRREQLAAHLNEGVRGLEGLTPPLARDGCRHVYYMWQMRYDETEMGVSRETFSQALAAEGFPNFLGYLNPLYRLPIFRDRIAIGGEGYPFNLTARSYPDGLCPVAEKLHAKELLGFDVCGFDVTPTEADLLVEAIRKVHGCRAALRSLTA
jgi:perosamine synthetase